MLGEPSRTQFDLNFVLMGIPVRVTPFFWVAALVLGFNLADVRYVRYLLEGTETIPVGTALPDTWAFVLMWSAAMFLSILIHEFGHALAFRYFGIHSHVVLYHMGGLAVPESGFGSFSTGRQLDSKAHIVVSAAGPAAQLIFAAIIILLVRVAGHQVPYYDEPFRSFLPIGDGSPVPQPMLHMFTYYLLWPSIVWAVINLFPIYPLDGGQIAREAFLLHNHSDGIRKSLILSVATGAIVAAYGVMRGQMFIGIMFGILAYMSYQQLQFYRGGGGGFGGYGGGGGGGFGGGGGKPW